MPVLDQPLIIAVTVVYLAAVMAIGVWASRRTRSIADYLVAGRDVGLLVTGLATMSAAFSGFVFIGGPGLTYRMGMASLFICLPVGFTAGLLCWTVAKRLRLLAEVRDVMTVPDAVLVRFGNRRASGLTALSIVVGSIGYLGAQLLAMGILIESIFGFENVSIGVGVGLVLVLAYAVGGGMIAGVYTDLLQGVVMMVAAVAVFGFAIDAGGGVSRIAESIVQSERFGPAFLDPLGNVPVVTAMSFFFVFSIGCLGQPHMLHKFYMLDDPRKLKWMPLVLGGGQAVCVLIWLGIGLAVPALVSQGTLPPLENPDLASPTFLLGFVPPMVAGVVVAGILAAIMSTADSFVNIAAAALVRDLPRAFGRRVANELRWSRVAVVGIAIVAAGFALVYGDLIALLGTFAFGTFGAALAPTIAIGLNWKRVTATAATASIATGLVANLGLELLAKQTWFPALPKPTFLAPGVLPSAVSLAASFTVLLVLAWLSPRRDTVLPDDVEAVMGI